jgi:hypothetical protein
MSSGACRALVAVLITLVASLAMAVPGAAESERLREQSTVIYRVDPAPGTIDVDIVVLTNNEPAGNGHMGAPILKSAVPRVSQGFQVGETRDLPGLWRAVTSRRPPGGNEPPVATRSTRPSAGGTAPSSCRRAGEAYVYVCLVGQTPTSASYASRPRATAWAAQSGTVMEPTAKGHRSTRSTNPAEHFTCIEGTLDERLATTTFIGPGDREIILQAWPESGNWLDAAESNAEPALDAIHAFLGQDIPGEGPVIIRQTPPRSLGGYASAHDTPGVVQLDESAGVVDPEHELAHAWFTTDDFTKLWLRRGWPSGSPQ